MASLTKANLALNLTGTLAKTIAGISVPVKLAHAYSAPLAGIGAASPADRIWQDLRTLTGTPEWLSLNNILKDAFGDLVPAARLKGLAIENQHATAELIVGGNLLTAPPAPVLAQSGTGGTIAAGTYGAIVTLVNAAGETLGSTAATVTTTGTTSTITVNSPVGQGNATGWYAYVTQAGGATYTRQQAAGSPTGIGTNLVLTAPPTSTGAAPPAAGTATMGGIASLFGSAADRLRVRPGGMVAVCAPDPAGYVIVAGSADQLKVDPQGANPLTYKITLAFAST